MFVLQRQETGVDLCGVRSPHTTSVRTAILDDLAVLLNGYRFGNGNRALDTIKPEDIGTCKKIVVDKYTTTFYNGDAFEGNILARIDQLKAQRNVAESPYDASVITDRISALQQGVAKISVGGQTELEVKEKYHRIEDALNAARAALEGGVIPGGGSALYRIANKLCQKSNRTAGETILSLALKAPFMQIIENIGVTDIDYSKLMKKDIVYDARNKKFKNGFTAGIIDPVKVTIAALENATSIAGLLSTTGGAIVISKK
jgi:chaperonin GroEL